MSDVGMGQSQPARIVTDAQQEYDSNPELRDLLARASASPTVRRTRQRRVEPSSGPARS